MAIDAGLLVLRVAVGLLLAAHGSRKVAGLLGGKGWADWRRSVAALGFRPAWLWAVMGGYAEVLGGPAVALGLLTPAACAALAVSMVVAVKTRLRDGFWESRHGTEYPLVLLAVFTALGVGGAGRWSLDAAWGLDAIGPAAFIALFGLGTLLSLPALLRRAPA